MKQLGVLLLLSQDGKLVYHRFPQHSVKLAHNLLVPICMPGLKPRPLNPKYIYILAHQYVIVPLHVVITFYIFSYVTLICRLAPLGVISLYVCIRDFLPFRQDRTAGNISASTTISAKSTECFAIWLNAENMCRCKN